MIAEIITNNFSIPAKNSAVSKICVGFNILSGVGGYEVRIKESGVWSSWKAYSIDEKFNLNSYYTQFFIVEGSYEFEIKDLNDSSIWSSGVYVLTSKNIKTGLPIGDTPIFNITTLNAGENIPISIKTVKPKSFVKVYKRLAASSTYDEFSIYATGFSSENQESDGYYLCSITLPLIASGDFICCSATDELSFESFSTNEITQGVTVANKIQLKLTYKDIVTNGKEVKTELTGGSGSYSISLNNVNFNLFNNTFFTIPFGKSNIFVKDTSTNKIFTFSVDGGLLQNNSQVQIDLSLRDSFSTTLNNNLGFKNGYIDSNDEFVEFNSYGIRDTRQSWGITGKNFPQIANNDDFTTLTSGTLPSDMLLFHPSADEGGSQNFGTSSAVRRYTFEKDGVLRNFSLKARKVGPNQNTSEEQPYPTCYVRLKVMLNYNIIYEKLFTLQDQYEQFNLTTDLIVYSGDVLDINVDSAEGLDQKSPDFDHLWVGYTGKYIYQNAQVKQVINKPYILSSNFINIFETTHAYKDIEDSISSPIITVYKDYYPYSIVSFSAQENNILPFKYTASKTGDFTFRNSISKLISGNNVYIYSDLSAIVSVSAQIKPVPTIVLSTTSSRIKLGDTVRGSTNISTNKINVYKEDVKIDTVTPTTILGRFFWEYKPLQITNLKGYSFSVSDNEGKNESVKTQYISVFEQELTGYTHTVSCNMVNCETKIIQFAILPENGVINNIPNSNWFDSLIGNFNSEGKLTPLTGEKRQYFRFKTNSEFSKFAFRQKDDITNNGILP
jgi:hypothetical protein